MVTLSARIKAEIKALLITKIPLRNSCQEGAFARINNNKYNGHLLLLEISQETRTFYKRNNLNYPEFMERLPGKEVWSPGVLRPYRRSNTKALRAGTPVIGTTAKPSPPLG